MNSAQYKAMVAKTVNGKTPKAGLRALASKPALAITTHAILGFDVEVGNLMGTLNQYILGFQMKPEWKHAATEDLGRCLYYAVMLARTLKTPVPGSGKRVRLHGMTLGACLMELHTTANHMVSALRNVIGGTADLSGPELVNLTSHAFELLWPLCTELSGSTPASVMVENAQQLVDMHPDGFFEKKVKPVAETPAATETPPTSTEEAVH